MSEYEWAAHEPPARNAGLTDDVVEALRKGEAPDFDDPAEDEIHEFCTQLLRTGRVSDAAFCAINERLGDAATVDLVGLIGHYCLVAMTINVFEVPTRDGSAPFRA
jgi:4-carboxymuconolactone decarboxylase